MRAVIIALLFNLIWLEGLRRARELPVIFTSHLRLAFVDTQSGRISLFVVGVLNLDSLRDAED